VTWTFRFLTVLVVVLLAAFVGRDANAQDKKSPPIPIKPDMEWKGSVDDEALLKAAPDSYIGDAKAFETLWKAWKLGDKVPDVDFTTHIVLVQTTRGSQLRVTAFIDDKGDLKMISAGTRDLRSGFRYDILSIKKTGIKTFDGKPLKE
jgi:hypothetical protein